jgi:GTPase SAR1 family protein
MSDPGTAIAYLVGIEKYDISDDLNVDGPVRNVLAFKKVLKHKGLKDENIKLFLSPLDENKTLIHPGLHYKNATETDLKNEILDIPKLSNKLSSNVLIFYWAGHGVVLDDTQPSRRLLYTDGNENEVKNLDLLNFFLRLRSEVGGIVHPEKQLFFIESCANHPGAIRHSFSHYAFPCESSSINNIKQWIFYAASQGQYASAKDGGSFTNTVLQCLNDDSLPRDGTFTTFPEVSRLRAKIEESFEPIAKDQTPYFTYFDTHENFSNPLKQSGQISRPPDEFTPQKIAEIPKRPDLRLDDPFQYIQLNLCIEDANQLDSGQRKQAEGSNRQKKQINDADFFLKRWLAEKNGVYYIIGDPGMGKTTLLKHWVKDLYENLQKDSKAPLPFFIELRDVNEETIEAYYRRKAATWEYVDKFSPKPFIEHPDQNIPVWIFDGWDELKSGLVESWKDVIRQLPGICIVSCREAYSKTLFGSSLNNQTYHLVELTFNQQEEFLKTFLGDTSSTNPSDLLDHIYDQEQLRELAKQPLMLELMAKHPDLARNPVNRGDFYHQTFEKFIERREQQIKSETGLNVAQFNDLKVEMRKFLMFFASKKLLEAQTSGRELEEICEQYIHSENGNRTSGELRTALSTSNLLKKQNEVWEPFHRTFQEFWLADALRKNNLISSIKKYWTNSEYDETLALLWGLKNSKIEELSDATDYLINVGKRFQFLNSRPTGNIGLDKALKLWSRSNLKVDGDSKKLILDSIKENRSKLNSAAKFPDTPKEILTELANEPKFDPATLQAIAGNSNTPLDVLEKLVNTEDQDISVLEEVAWNSEISEKIIELLKSKKAYDRSVSIRQGIASNSKTPPSILNELLSEKNPDINQRLAQNPNIAPNKDQTSDRDWSMVDELLKCRHPDVFKHLVENYSVPDDKLKSHLAESPFLYARKIASSSRASREMLFETKKLSSDNPEVLALLAANRNSNNSLLKDLIGEGVRIAQRIAQNPSSSEETLRDLFEKYNNTPAILRALARHEKTPKDILAKIFQEHSDEETLREIVENPSIDLEVLKTIYENSGKDSYILRQKLAGHPKLPYTILKCLAGDDSYEVKETVMRNPQFGEFRKNGAMKIVRELFYGIPNISYWLALSSSDSVEDIENELNQQTKDDESPRESKSFS